MYGRMVFLLIPSSVYKIPMSSIHSCDTIVVEDGIGAVCL
jgi:hypothetical protein